jgi:hypothetical protein
VASSLAKALTAAGSLPGIEESTSYGTPSLKVRGKFIARIKEPGILVVRCPLEEKEMLMAAAPAIYFETDHYKGWPVVLIRMSKITKADLAKRLETAWRMQAPKTLQKAFDDAPSRAKARR